VKLLVQKKCKKCRSTYSAAPDSSDYCEECRNTEQPPANNPEFTVEDIIGESKYLLPQCRRCGKTQGWVARNSLSFRFYRMCDTCFAKYVNYLKSPNVRSCDKCGFFEKSIREDEENTDSLLAYFDSPNMTFKCRKFGFEIIPKKLLLAQECAGFITKQKYAEKCLNGEINPTARNIVICEYCKSSYDLFKSTRCPYCGGSAKIPTA
jgi:hypothetical protein